MTVTPEKIKNWILEGMDRGFLVISASYEYDSMPQTSLERGEVEEIEIKIRMQKITLGPGQ